jgi:hypothetical protein
MYSRCAVIVFVTACAAEKTAESPGSASPRPAQPVAAVDKGPGSAAESDPCAGGQVTEVANQGIGELGRGHTPTVPHVEDSPPTVSGAIDRGVIQRVVRKSMSSIGRCYETTNATTDARLEIRFTIEATGKVSKVAATGGSPDLMRCLEGVFGKLEFAQSPGSIEVSYPINFKAS